MVRNTKKALRRGWTTGACAAAAARGAFEALHTGEFPDCVTIRLPKGDRPTFELCEKQLAKGSATAGVVKDAGDDPDVTHGVTVLVTVSLPAESDGIEFYAGDGVGTITKPGLPLPPGEPAINPGPREIISDAIKDIAESLDVPPVAAVSVSIPNGLEIAAKTWNPRLGIVGGLSILGTTGVVIPYSCSAWIHSIHRGVDVARSTGVDHIIAATGKTSEAAAQKIYAAPDGALIDMGDFAGGLLKYLRRRPVRRLTIAGGFAKLLKLSQGHLDLHSARSQVDFTRLSQAARSLGAGKEQAARIAGANTAAEVLSIVPALPLGDMVARGAREVALATLAGGVDVDVLVIDRKGKQIGSAGRAHG